MNGNDFGRIGEAFAGLIALLILAVAALVATLVGVLIDWPTWYLRSCCALMLFGVGFVAGRTSQ